MNYETIGNNAGLVWNTLNNMGKMNVKTLKKLTKIKTDKELFSAIGWLAKEGKLIFEDIDDELMISLSY